MVALAFWGTSPLQVQLFTPLQEGTLYNTQLQKEVSRILKPLEVKAGAENRLLVAYSEPWRTYHNASHILKMLELSRNLDLDIESQQHLELLIVYHDVWYKVGRSSGENEQKSAEWAWIDLIGDNTPKTVRLTRMLKQGILATTNHTLDGINPEYVEEIAALLDCDLWGLGQDPEQFREDTEKVWGEYQPIATREEFDAGRSSWARTFLSRPNIYHTEAFLHLEQQARRNLEQLAG